MSIDDHVFEQPRNSRLIHGDSNETFDRVAFAMGLLRLMSPPRMTVAVYECRQMRIERGRDLGRGEGARFGILGIPARASRSHVVLAVAELTGVEKSLIVDLASAAPDGAVAELARIRRAS